MIRIFGLILTVSLLLGNASANDFSRIKFDVSGVPVEVINRNIASNPLPNASLKAGLWLLTVPTASQPFRLKIEIVNLPHCPGNVGFFFKGPQGVAMERAPFDGKVLQFDYLPWEDDYLIGEFEVVDDGSFSGEIETPDGDVAEATLEFVGAKTSVGVREILVNFNALPKVVDGSVFVRDPKQAVVKGSVMVAAGKEPHYYTCYRFDQNQMGTGIMYSFLYPSSEERQWAPIPMSNLQGKVWDFDTNAVAARGEGPLFMMLRSQRGWASTELLWND